MSEKQLKKEVYEQKDPRLYFASDPDHVFVTCLVMNLQITCIYTGECFQIDFHDREKYPAALKEILQDWVYQGNMLHK